MGKIIPKHFKSFETIPKHSKKLFFFGMTWNVLEWWLNPSKCANEGPCQWRPLFPQKNIHISVDHPNTFRYHIFGNEYSVHLPGIELYAEYALGLYQLKNGLPMNHKITHTQTHTIYNFENFQASMLRRKTIRPYPNLSIPFLVKSGSIPLLGSFVWLTVNHFATQWLTRNSQCDACATHQLPFGKR